MSSIKVIPDTNVVVAASIMENIDEIGIIKHHFYDQSIQLFSLFKSPNGIEGFAIPKVKAECFGVLSRAVKEVFVPKQSMDLSLKEKFYNNAVGIISSSEHKMRSLLSRLRKVKIDQKNVQNNLRDVEDMSRELQKLYHQTYQRYNRRRKESKERSKPILSEPKWQKEQKMEVVNTHGEQVTREAKQLERFMRKYPNTPDQKILAEVITFKQSLVDSDHYVLVASSDTGFFSPYHYYGGKSDTVTEAIYNRFKIRCDHPREIFCIAGGIV